MPIAVFRSWINSAGELSTVEYAACDNGVMKIYEYKLADGRGGQADGKGADAGRGGGGAAADGEPVCQGVRGRARMARTPGNMEETVNPGLSISFINARYAYSGELDFGELTYVYSLSTRKIAPVDGEYAGAKEYGIMCGGYPQAFIFIDK